MAASREEMRAARLRALEQAAPDASSRGDIQETEAAAAPDPSAGAQAAFHARFTELVAGGVPANEAAAQAILSLQGQKLPATAVTPPSLDAALSNSDLVAMRRVLWAADAPEDDRRRWHQQGFEFCDGEPSFGLRQGNGGPCGVLAAVQAELIRCLLFGAKADESRAGCEVHSEGGGRSLPSPSPAEVQIHLGEALLIILARCRPGADAPICVVTCRRPSVVCCLEAAPPFAQTPNSQPATPATEFEVTRFASPDDDARCFLASVLPQFQSPSGVVLFLMGCLLSRGVDAVKHDMDDPSATLIGQFGHCAQELLNLLLSGSATSNCFDGSVPMGDSGLTLRGVGARSHVGYLTHLEALRYCQVGSFYKTPYDPVWVVGSTSHFTVLFGTCHTPVTETRSELLLAHAGRAFRACDPDEQGFIPTGSLRRALADLAQEPAPEGGALLPPAMATEANVAVLLAHLETAGAGIVLWDSFWQCVSRLMSGASLEAVLQGNSNAAAGSAGGAQQALAQVPHAGPTTPPLALANQPPAAAAVGARTRSDSADLASAIAASLTPSANANAAPSAAVMPAAAPPAEEEGPSSVWACGACTFGNAAAAAQCDMCGTARPAQATAQAPAAAAPAGGAGARAEEGGRPRTDSEELAAAIAASLDSDSEPPPLMDANRETRETAADPALPSPQALSRGVRLSLFHYNGMSLRGHAPSSASSPAAVADASPLEGGRGAKAAVRAGKLVEFAVVKRGDEEMVGVAVPLGASGGTGSVGGLGSDHAIEDVLRTRWPGCTIDWRGQTPPSID